MIVGNHRIEMPGRDLRFSLLSVADFDRYPSKLVQMANRNRPVVTFLPHHATHGNSSLLLQAG
jgi:hypothetical protein